MNWRTKFVAIVYDLFLSAYFALAIFWLTLLIGVPYGAVTLLSLFLPAILAIFIVSILVHELGHLVAAIAMGLKISLFAFWPLMVVQSGRGFQLWHFNLPSPMLGTVAAVPRNVNLLAWKRGLFLCAGPMVSLLAALGGLALTYAVNESHYDLRSVPFWNRLIPRNGAAVLLYATWLLNLFLFIASLRPVPFKKFSTDGAALLSLICAGGPAVRMWLAEALSAASLNGVRPGKLDHEMIDYLLSTQDGSVQDVSGNFFGFYYFLDTRQSDRAGELIDMLVANREKFDPRHKSYALLEAVYFEARHRHNAVAARRWLDQALTDDVEPQTYLRAQAAVLLIEGQYKEAAVIAKAALVVLPKSADPGGAIAEKEWLESILAEGQRRLGQ